MARAYKSRDARGATPGGPGPARARAVGAGAKGPRTGRAAGFVWTRGARSVQSSISGGRGGAGRDFDLLRYGLTPRGAFRRDGMGMGSPSIPPFRRIGDEDFDFFLKKRIGGEEIVATCIAGSQLARYP